MSENSVLYEITQMIQDKNTVENDMKEIMDTVSGAIQKKYLSRLQEAISTHQQRVQQSPPKEIQLIKALKPFTSEENHASMDKFADMMLMMNTLKSINTEMSSINKEFQAAEAVAEERLESVHDNGIYDIDNRCLIAKKENSVNMAGLIMMMALFK